MAATLPFRKIEGWRSGFVSDAQRAGGIDGAFERIGHDDCYGLVVIANLVVLQ
jgi:hypothetical protein